ncbi:MAG: hypothetical protein ACJ79S_19090 [Gemmatimonadaceae bacterium]
MTATTPPDEVGHASLRRRRRATLGAVAAAVVTLVAVLAALRSPGPGLQYDGVVYLSTAQQLVREGKLATPYAVYPFSDALPNDSTPALTHWPPGYSLAIASLHATGLSLLDSARAIQATSAALTVGLLVFLLADAASLAAGLLCAAALLVTPFAVEDNAQVLSEPLFLALVVSTAASMVARPSRPMLYGLLAALASATRYLGLGVAASAGVWALLSGGSRTERARRAALAVAPSMLFFVGWALRARSVVTPRQESGLHTDGFGATAYRGVATIGRWLIPETAVASPAWAGVAFALAVAVLAAVTLPAAARALRPLLHGELPATRRGRLATALALLTLACVATLLASRLAADPNVVMDARILMPTIVLMEAALALALWGWWRRAGRAARLFGAVAFAAWTVASIRSSEQRLYVARRTGFADPRWARSSTVAWVRDNGSALRIFSNVPPAVYLYAGRSSRALPPSESAASAAAFQRTLLPDSDVIVYFYPSRDANRPEARPALAPTLRLDTLAALSDGIVLRPSGPGRGCEGDRGAGAGAGCALADGAAP